MKQKQKNDRKKNNINERNKIKRQALDKLDSLLEGEFQRLYALSHDKPLWDQFEICFGNDYFSQEELDELEVNIGQFNKLSSSDVNEKKRAIDYLRIALQLRPINWPWETMF